MKFTGYKTNTIPFIIAFLYRSNENSEREIKQTIPFIIASRRAECLFLPQVGRTILKEKTCTLKTVTYWWKKLKTIQKDTPCSWIGRINIVKMNILPKPIYRFNAIPIKSSMALFTELEPRKSFIFIWKHKRPWIVKAILRKTKEAGGTRLPDFRIYYKPTLIKTVWYGTKNSSKSSEINICT